MSKRRSTRLTGFEALNAAFSQKDHTRLTGELGVDLDDERLALALTHRSFANENDNLPNNERLEFLGDAVLGLVVAHKLFELYPSRPESDISKMRASVVSRYGCAEVARDIGLGDHILLGKGEISGDGAQKDSILADTVEALIGAVYLQHGFDVSRDMVLRLFAKKIAEASSKGMHEDWKTALQERAAELKIAMPVYDTESTGPEHDLVFTAVARIDGRALGEGSGHNKKLAEQDAARQAWLALRRDPGSLKETISQVEKAHS